MTTVELWGYRNSSVVAISSKDLPSLQKHIPPVLKIVAVLTHLSALRWLVHFIYDLYFIPFFPFILTFCQIMLPTIFEAYKLDITKRLPMAADK
jgi:hypothetical protein